MIVEDFPQKSRENLHSLSNQELFGGVFARCYSLAISSLTRINVSISYSDVLKVVTRADDRSKYRSESIETL